MEKISIYQKFLVAGTFSSQFYACNYDSSFNAMYDEIKKKNEIEKIVKQNNQVVAVDNLKVRSFSAKFYNPLFKYDSITNISDTSSNQILRLEKTYQRLCVSEETNYNYKFILIMEKMKNYYNPSEDFYNNLLEMLSDEKSKKQTIALYESFLDLDQDSKDYLKEFSRNLFSILIESKSKIAVFEFLDHLLHLEELNIVYLPTYLLLVEFRPADFYLKKEHKEENYKSCMILKRFFYLQYNNTKNIAIKKVSDKVNIKDLLTDQEKHLLIFNFKNNWEQKILDLAKETLSSSIDSLSEQEKTSKINELYLTILKNKSLEYKKELNLFSYDILLTKQKQISHIKQLLTETARILSNRDLRKKFDKGIANLKKIRSLNWCGYFSSEKIFEVLTTEFSFTSIEAMSFQYYLVILQDTKTRYLRKNAHDLLVNNFSEILEELTKYTEDTIKKIVFKRLDINM